MSQRSQIHKVSTFLPESAASKSRLPSESRTSAASHAELRSSSQTLEPLRKFMVSVSANCERKREIETLEAETCREKSREWWWKCWVPALRRVEREYWIQVKNQKWRNGWLCIYIAVGKTRHRSFSTFHFHFNFVSTCTLARSLVAVLSLHLRFKIYYSKLTKFWENNNNKDLI